MRLITTHALVGGLALAATAANAAPSSPQQLSFASTEAPSISAASWLSSGISSLLKSAAGDKTIYDVITTHAEFSKLAKAVNYSSEETKDLLKGKTGGKLTLFAPKDWKMPHHKRDDEMTDAHLAQVGTSWALLDQKVEAFEAAEALRESSDDDDDDDDDEKRRRRRMLAKFIDSVLAYHLVDTSHPLKASSIAQNSTVATKLSITGKLANYIGKLSDGQPLRLRVGKSLVPKPGVYLNFYSRVVYPDVELANGIIHVVDYPLFQFPSILQGLYFTQPQFSTLTSAFQKTKSDGYLALPPMKHHGGHDGHNESHSDHHHHQHRRPDFSDPKGTEAATLFAPSNAAWDRLPWSFRAYLFSPWGRDLLGKVLMLHSIPDDIVYADSVHHVHRNGRNRSSSVATTTTSMENGANVTRYTFDSVLPKLRRGHDTPPPDEAKEFEQVDVAVYRYYLLPGSKGPLQTRMEVQGVPVLIQDVVNLNGAGHLITKFIKPKGHPHEGVWADVAREASAYGFGEVDLMEEARVEAW
ncbi:hypothetical protein BDZ90DRAFT_265355 [Jaminaea rosea]|uniref:FAS1 domain-containing protein n=1 Tax=Jaminaea rosea TaxID=1569628 RepID=A0A316USK3_9BASI|nr:hypothetical protein BDZ90DRAFT_265355 [Jaminaea rosea]PWN26115.1 hypothetical protein BDZ90DRAFT_265355 [Jaminaea rosea]